MRFPQVSANTFTERAGVIEVSKIINDARCLWRETTMHDVGIDGQIEYVDTGGSATGRLILVQIKAGKSYFDRRQDEAIIYTPAEKHLQYWARAPAPVILILHDSDRGLTIWTDARRQIRSGATRIIIPCQISLIVPVSC